MDTIILDLSSVKISGECQLEGYKGMIELLYFSHSDSGQITGGKSNAACTSGKPSYQSCMVTKYQDLASVQLLDFYNQEKIIPTATITVGQNDGGKITKPVVYTMTNALIHAVSTAGSGSGKPLETLIFNYTAISRTGVDGQPDAAAR
jgi:type VI protein secretion system component Hcp